MMLYKVRSPEGGMPFNVYRTIHAPRVPKREKSRPWRRRQRPLVSPLIYGWKGVFNPFGPRFSMINFRPVSLIIKYDQSSFSFGLRLCFLFLFASSFINTERSLITTGSLIQQERQTNFRRALATCFSFFPRKLRIMRYSVTVTLRCFRLPWKPKDEVWVGELFFFYLDRLPWNPVSTPGYDFCLVGEGRGGGGEKKSVLCNRCHEGRGLTTPTSRFGFHA